MAKDIPLLGENERDWAGPDDGNWLVRMTWGEVDGRAECIGLEVRSYAPNKKGTVAQRIHPDTPIRPLRSDVFRALNMELVEEGRRSWLDTLRHFDLNASGWAADPAGQEKVRSALDAFDQAARRYLVGSDGERLSADRALEEIAKAYREIAKVSNQPTKDVAQKLGLSRAATAHRVARARAAGLLPPATTGRPKRKD